MLILVNGDECFPSISGCMQVVVEFAKHGNLRDFLRRLKPAIVADADEETRNDAADGDDSRHHGKEDGADEEEEEVYLTPVQSGDDDGSSRQMTFSDLISFCFQVARGMEYLSSRKAGDLWITMIFHVAAIPIISR